MTMESNLDQPALSAPPGQTSNLINPPNQKWLWTLLTVITLTICTSMVWIRMYVGLIVTRDFRWDDILVFVSWILYIAQIAIRIEFTKHGALVDLWNVSLRDYRAWLRLAYFDELTYAINILMIKLAILILYRRVFVPLKKRNRVWWTIMTVIAFNVMFYIAYILVKIFVCTPIKRAWEPEVPGTCVDIKAAILTAGALNAVSDFFILAIPIAVVGKLHLRRRRKAELLALFAAGALCFASSVIRMAYSALNIDNPNQTVALMKVALWTYAETTSCFLASCIPMVPRFILHLRGKTSGRNSQAAVVLSPPRDTRSYSEKRGSLQKYPMISSFLETRGSRDEAEDPYLLDKAEFSSPDVSKSNNSTFSNRQDITVEMSWNIRSVSETRLPSKDRPFVWPSNCSETTDVESTTETQESV